MSSKPSHVGSHKKALAEYYQMSTYVPGFQSFPSFVSSFNVTKLATSSIRVKVGNFSHCFGECGSGLGR